MNTHWKLEVYHQDGTTVATASHTPNDAPGPHQIQGDMIAVIEALPSITGLSRFFTDPDALARAAYTAYAEAWEETFGRRIWTWEEILATKNSEKKAKLIQVWRTVAQAAAAVDPTLN